MVTEANDLAPLETGGMLLGYVVEHEGLPEAVIGQIIGPVQMRFMVERVSCPMAAGSGRSWHWYSRNQAEPQPISAIGTATQVATAHRARWT